MSKLTRVLIFDIFLPWDSGILVFMTINLPPFTKPTIPLKLLKKITSSHTSTLANLPTVKNCRTLSFMNIPYLKDGVKPPN